MVHCIIRLIIVSLLYTNINTAKLILANIVFNDVIQLKFTDGQIANLPKSVNRKIGKAVESHIKLMFSQT